MGEAKRRIDRMTEAQKLAEALTHKLADEGLIMRAGFAGYMGTCFPHEQPSDLQRRELEQAFMAGALHLWSSMMTFLSEDEEPTAKDMKRVELIDAELEAYGEVLKARAASAMETKGSA